MTRIAWLAAIASLILIAPAASHAQSALPTAMFVKTAAQTDEFERREGRLAEKVSANPRVQAFGARMVADHTKTTEALEAAIRRAGMPAPPPPPLTGKQSADMASLQTLHGQAFDRAYIDQQIRAHEAALGVIQAYATNGDNPFIRQAAANTVPIVQHHLQMARSLRNAT